MPLQPVSRRSVPDEVFEQIVADVLSGEMQPGEALPSERRLAEILGASRPAVREALKRLSAAGLVEVRQGNVTTVRDFRQHAGLDLLSELLFRGGRLDISVAHSLLEAWLRIGPRVADLAAERHRPELTEKLDSSLRTLDTENDPTEWQRHALKFWDHVVDGADEIVFRLMYNAFRGAYDLMLRVLDGAVTADIKRAEAYRNLAEAIRGGDSAEAKKLAHNLIQLANTTVLDALDSTASQR